MLSLNIEVYLRIWHTHWAGSCPTFFFLSIRAIIDPGSQFHIVVKYSFAILVDWVESGDGLVIVAWFASDNLLQFMQALWCNHNNYNLPLINYLSMNLLSLNNKTLFKVLEGFFFPLACTLHGTWLALHARSPWTSQEKTQSATPECQLVQS